MILFYILLNCSSYLYTFRKTGFGWGIGSAVINGALEAIQERPDKYSEDQLILKPFPQFETGDKKLPALWDEYRQRMISMAGIAIFLFGNKKDDFGNIISAEGVKKEFNIAISKGLVPIAIPMTGYAAEELYNEIIKNPSLYYEGMDWIIPIMENLSSAVLTPEENINKIILIIEKINK